MSVNTNFKDISPIPSILLGAAVATHSIYINDRNEEKSNNDKHIITIIYSYYLAYVTYIFKLFIYDSISEKHISILLAFLIIMPSIFLFIKTKMNIYENWFDVNKYSRHNIVYSYMLLQLVFSFIYIVGYFKEYNVILFYLSIMFIVFYFIMNKISVPSPISKLPFTTMNWYVLDSPFALETDYEKLDPSEKWISTNVNIYNINDTEYSYMEFLSNDHYINIDIDKATLRFTDDGPYFNLEEIVPEYIKSLVSTSNDSENIVFFKSSNEITYGSNVNIKYTNKEVTEEEKKFKIGDFIEIKNIKLVFTGDTNKYLIKGDHKLLTVGDEIRFKTTTGIISEKTYPIDNIKSIGENYVATIIGEKEDVMFEKITDKQDDYSLSVYSENTANKIYKLPSNDGLVNFIKIIENLNIIITVYIFGSFVISKN